MEVYDSTSYQAHDYAPKHLRDGNFPCRPHARRSCCHPLWQQLRPSHDTAAKARPGRCLSHSADDWLRRQGIGGCRTRAPRVVRNIYERRQETTMPAGTSQLRSRGVISMLRAPRHERSSFAVGATATTDSRGRRGEALVTDGGGFSALP